MNIIIVGAGKVGSKICQFLKDQKHKIAVIDKNEKTLMALQDEMKVKTFVGNGSIYDMQVKAGVQEADVFVAVTPEDEVNMIACVIANKLGAKTTIALVRNSDYHSHMEFASIRLGVSMMINPDYEAAQHIHRSLDFPNTLFVETFFNQKVNLLEIEIHENSPLLHLSLIDFRKLYPSILVCVHSRNHESTIPTGNHRLEKGDRIHILGPVEDLKDIQFHLYKQEKIQSLFIIGADRISRYLLEIIKDQAIDVCLIDNNQKIAENLSKKYPHMRIIHGDGKDTELLLRENLDSYEAFLSMTGNDSANIYLTEFARKRAIPKLMTKINGNKPYFLQSGHYFIEPEKNAAQAIIRYIRSINKSFGSNMEALYRIDDDDSIEFLQFYVRPHFQAIHIPLKNLFLKKDILIALIMRNKKCIIPTGDAYILPYDRVLLVTKNRTLNDLNTILEEGSDPWPI